MASREKGSSAPLLIAVIAAVAILVVAMLLLIKRPGRSSVPESLPESSAAEISEESSESESSSEEESSGTPESSGEPEESSETESSGAPESSGEPEESSAPAESGGSETSSEPEVSAPDYGKVDSSGYTYPDRVPASAEADESWFDDALFIGDSITEGIKAYNLLGNATVVSNVGISLYNIETKECINTGDGTRITIPQAVAQYPNKTRIYIQLGVNGMGMTIDQFKKAYTGFISTLRKSHPDASIYLVSIFPISEQKFYNNGYPRSITNKKIDEFNNAIMEVATANDAYFLYVSECIKQPDGSLDPNVTGDGMHIGPAYYERWFKYMRTHAAS